ncbi:MAG: Alkyl hydroperoxide reductase, F subunit [Parcubacteria group bacterium GW2011_GWF2_44_7]|nr:MAG: Alkyl hydroperoxide reductase, F subunit [Parcubacteria group bacterium GW2011_GWF2_44_7]
MHDLIIIGAGPAGLSAAIYAVRKKLRVLVLAQMVGGQTIDAHLVENYLGVPEILGIELVEKFKEHAKKFDTEIKENISVQKITKGDADIFSIKTNKGDFQAKALIIASGKKYRQLTVSGAMEFEGKGITYCATCDAPLFKDKKVAVIGAGDAGQDAAWQLTQYAEKIYLFNRYQELRGDDVVMQEKLKQHPKIEIIDDAYPVEIKGDKFVQALVYQQNGSADRKEIAVSGIFVEIGSVPVSEYLKDMVELNEKGEIIVNPKTNMASCPGIFAAGDVTDIPHKQMIIAAGEGAKAALSAYEYLK